jgi:hypothetical protein
MPYEMEFAGARMHRSLPTESVEKFGRIGSIIGLSVLVPLDFSNATFFAKKALDNYWPCPLAWRAFLEFRSGHTF